jgi:hypothetical protein
VSGGGSSTPDTLPSMRRGVALSFGLLLIPACKQAERAEHDPPTATTAEATTAAELAQGSSPQTAPVVAPESAEPNSKSGSKPELAPPSSPFLVPAEVLARATPALRYLEQDRCELPEAFPSFMLDPARRVHFANDWGRVSATVPCKADAEVDRLDIYPQAEPNRRYVVHFIEAGLSVEERRDGRWSRRCDGASCRDVAAEQSDAWIAGYELAKLHDPVFALVEALAIPDHFEALSSAPILSAEQARGFIVFARKDELLAVRPDGSAPFSLGLAAPDRDSSSSFGPAEDRPLLSPDGALLAHLDGGALRLTSLADKQTRAVEGLPSHVLIGPWSPDGRALLVYAGEPSPDPYAVDVESGQAQRITGSKGRLQWGDSHRELIDARVDAKTLTLVASSPPDLATGQPIASLPFEPRWQVQDARAGRIAGVSPTAIWALTRGGEPVDVAEVELFFGGVRLSPDARHLAFPAAPTGAAEVGYLTAVPLDGGAPIPLLPCSQTCKFYWYDAEHVVMLGPRSIHMASLDGKQTIVVEDAAGVGARRAR